MNKMIRKFINSKLCTLHRMLSSSINEGSVKTAGIIGDEILKGDAVDTNSRYMTSRLHKSGIKVKKISIIGDTIEEIAYDVREFSKRYNYVITSGGIGPTHDDVTFAGVAKAFNEKLYAHPELLEICCKFYNTSDRNAPGMKLAYVPQSSALIYGTNKASGVKSKYPVIRVHNVYIFPGIPHLCENAFELIHEALFTSHSKFYTRCIYVNIAEYQIAGTLDSLVKRFPKVCFGSYPRYADGAYTVKITIESVDEKSTKEAYNCLLELIPKEALINKVKE